MRRADVTVNAIAIEQSEPDLTAYFYEHVIEGEGAFVETARSFRDYPEKIRRKLVREVARKTASIQPPQQAPKQASPQPSGYASLPQPILPVFGGRKSGLQEITLGRADSAKQF